ncbi:putative alpha-glucosidase (maltase) [Apiospora kogelbergensis]|uniref:Alpha-glucosidase (Maltase) n=1 Tax=Apiospora kogelbergensis TaxID=1337665 RepID=A0AAW0RBE1_9PEZI
MTSSSSAERKWWKEAVVYQIYPASFLDSNGDGLGDLNGIISKLDYIKGLGATAIWLSPIFKSPQKDMGYDVSDYRSIHAPYGSLEDAEQLIKEMHHRDIKLLLDLVVNHTSDQHAWFQESRQSKTNPKSDWYIWRDAKIGPDGNAQEPNNWRSIFGGSAWHWCKIRQQYYLALFLSEQPDLNWDNAGMRKATHEDMRFWLDRGVDGFRIDSMNLMSKHPDLPDAAIVDPQERYQPGDAWFALQPNMHVYLQEMRREVFDHYDVMTVGELGFTKDADSVRAFVARDRRELDMVFTGDIVDMDFGAAGKYARRDFHPSTMRDITDKWQTAMPRFDGWNSVYLENHDSGRSVSRYASDRPEHRANSAKLLATYLLSLGGTPFLLAGEEIGMANLGPEYGIDAYIDVEGRNHYRSVLEARGGDDSSMGDVLREMQLKARDHGRLPMQWSAEANAGFTSSDARPWMTVNKDHFDWNVAAQLDDKDSVYAYYKSMLAIRKEYMETLVYGKFEMLPVTRTGEFGIGYERKGHGKAQEHMVVFLNLSEAKLEVPSEEYQGWSVVIGNNSKVDAAAHMITLNAYGAIVLKK